MRHIFLLHPYPHDHYFVSAPPKSDGSFGKYCCKYKRRPFYHILYVFSHVKHGHCNDKHTKNKKIYNMSHLNFGFMKWWLLLLFFKPPLFTENQTCINRTQTIKIFKLNKFHTPVAIRQLHIFKLHKD